VASDAEHLGGIVHRLLVIESLAGENIQAQIVALREGVNADMAFRNEDKPGEAPIIRHFAVIFEGIRGHDLGHVDHIRAGVQELVNGVQIRQPLITAFITIQGQMQSKANRRLFQISLLLAPEDKGVTGTCPAGKPCAVASAAPECSHSGKIRSWAPATGSESTRKEA